MSLPVNTSLGHYKVLSRLGAGGMGEVYLAQDTKLGRRVALKILPGEVASDRERMQRFMQEAQAASALNHPNIITIYEIQETAPTPYIATEFIDGEDLRQSAKRGRLGVSESLDVMIQLASALSAAHACGIIHRDIKPENVMLRRDGVVKLVDFGLAKLGEGALPADDAETPTREAMTEQGAILGTLPYMSPEQARGLAIDGLTDIWSLGCVLYEMVTGARPFTGETPADVLAGILKGTPAPLSSYRKDVPAKLEEIVAKALEKEKGKRYQAATDLLVDLRGLKRDLELEADGASSRQPGIPVQAEAGVSANLPPNNLSLRRSTIVGRDREIQEVCDVLRGPARLVTLTGIGGTGKTTLGVAAAGQVVRDFADGVFVVELAEVKQAELVASSIAQALGVKEGDARPILQSLKEHLRSRVMLLVLDNFEQVLPAASALAELLAAAPGLKLLVTSRSLLQLSSEREYVVPPLATPKLTAEGSPDELMRYDAVKLFVDRARAGMAGFALTSENARTVAEICARLDGLPLGIELATARMKMLSPQAILTRLDNRLKLLTGGARDLPTRLQTMRGTLDWSYELLTDNEKRTFGRLAVFAGGFTLESAEKVVGGEGSVSAEGDESDVLDILTRLVNQSLLVAEKEAGGDVRFRMLGVVREYALDRLEAGGEVKAMRQRHAAHFLALAEEAEPHLQSAEQGAWLNRLDEEYDNIREALHWLVASDRETAARLGAAMRYFWIFMGYLTEGLGVLEQILSQSDRVPAAQRCKLFSMAGNISKFQGNHEAARKMYERGLAEARSLGNRSDVSLLCRGLGGLAVEEGDYTTAQRFIGEALDAAREANDQFGIARSLNMMGDLARTEGDDGTARILLKAALALCRQGENKYATANILNNLAAAECGDGDYEAASAHFTEALTMERGDAKVAGDRIAISYSLDGFAALAVQRGEAKLAARLAGAAEHLRESMNFQTEAAERRFREKYVASIRAMLPEDQFAAAYEEGCKLEMDEGIALALQKELP